MATCSALSTSSSSPSSAGGSSARGEGGSRGTSSVDAIVTGGSFGSSSCAGGGSVALGRVSGGGFDVVSSGGGGGGGSDAFGSGSGGGSDVFGSTSGDFAVASETGGGSDVGASGSGAEGTRLGCAASVLMDAGGGVLLRTMRGFDGVLSAPSVSVGGGAFETGRELRLRLLERPFLMYPRATLEPAVASTVNARWLLPALFHEPFRAAGQGIA